MRLNQLMQELIGAGAGAVVLSGLAVHYGGMRVARMVTPGYSVSAAVLIVLGNALTYWSVFDLSRRVRSNAAWRHSVARRAAVLSSLACIFAQVLLWEALHSPVEIPGTEYHIEWVGMSSNIDMTLTIQMLLLAGAVAACSNLAVQFLGVPVVQFIGSRVPERGRGRGE